MLYMAIKKEDIIKSKMDDKEKRGGKEKEKT